MTGDLIPVAEADRIGLVSQVVPAEGALDAMMDFARRLYSGASLAVRSRRLSIQRMIQQNVLHGLDMSLYPKDDPAERSPRPRHVARLGGGHREEPRSPRGDHRLRRDT
jgi:enoyl-CoA hydratase/carnithine racemase